MIDRLEQRLSLNRAALNLRSYRQELLSSNIANADTPHYKARDVDFKSALETAMPRNDGADRLNRSTVQHLPNFTATGMTRTSPRHFEGESQPRWDAVTQYRAEYQGAVDGNTVNMDVERAAFAENATHIEALLTFVRSTFTNMQTAIQGQ